MTENLIRIGDIEKFSIVDFPNSIAVVVFMQGCPWKCPFCYNQSLQNPNEKTQASWEHLLHLLEHRKGMIDAVVFSGGEPLLQSGLYEAIKVVKDMGFNAAMHTGGYNPTAMKKVVNELVWVGFDVKAPFEAERYKTATGGFADVEKVKQSLEILLASNIHFECRTTCDPRILDLQDIYKIADTLSSLGVKEYYLQKYRPIESDKTTQDADCEKFFHDEKLLQYLQEKFTIFSVRK